MSLKRLLPLALVLLPAAAFAGPVADFETALRGAYGNYRAALFQSNAGNAEGTAKAIGDLAAQWTAIETQWGANPPPQYGDDAGFAATLTTVEKMAAEAGDKAKSGNLAATHEALEGIRAQIGDLHLCNGLYTFSDRMNAYHAKMEEVLALPADGDLTSVLEAAAVLDWLAQDIAAHPAPESADPAYAGLLKAMQSSVSGLQDAARRGDAAAVKAAIGALKPAYSKFFVKFG